MSNFVKKYPAISMFIVAELLGVVLLAPIAFGIAPADSMFFMLAAFSVSLAGIILTAIVSGKAGLRKMFRKLLIWRVGIQWWVIALFAVAFIYLGGMFLVSLFNGVSLDLSHVGPIYMIIPLLLFATLTHGGLGEELGWRGFLLPRLQVRYSALVSSIIIGILWGLWHTPLFLIEGIPFYYELGQTYGVIPAVLGLSFLLTVPWSILLTWMYNHTKGSLLLVCVFHGAEAWKEYFVDPEMLAASEVGFAVVLTIVAIVVVFTSGAENLSRTHERIMIHDA